MELWIRNQDKENLIKVSEIWIDDTDMVDRGCVSIMANLNFSFELGVYKTKERALEVLDEIQKLIEPKTLINVENFNTNDARVLCDKFKEYSPVIVRNDNIKIEPLSFIVYEMPKE